MAESSRLRVLMVVERLYGLGGAQKQALRLVRALRTHDIEARIATGRWRLSEPSRAEVEGVTVTALFTAFKMFHIKGLRKLGTYLYLASLLFHLWLHRKSYDLIHVHSATVSAFVVALAGKWLKKPTVMKVMASGGWSDFKRMQSGIEVTGSAFMARHIRGVDRVICLNPEVETECRALGFTEEQTVSIPNGFPVLDVSPRRGYESRGRIIVTFSGRLDAQKNPRCLMEAMSICAQYPGAPELNLKVLGDGPQRSEVEELIGRLRIDDIVQLFGRVEDVETHLHGTDIFVLPSLAEGISNALLEAMAHGLPCIATRIPGNVDLIRDRDTGLLVEPADAEGLARAIVELASDAALREKLGRAARAFVEQSFDMDGVSRRYAEMYGELVRQQPVSASA